MDIYTDKGETLKRRFGDELPELVKTAVYMDAETRARVPDDAYAYVTSSLRELPLVDKGNVAISSIYFLDNRDKFPPAEITKIASKLVAACVKFELAVPNSLTKLAAYTPPKPKVETKTTVASFERAVNQFIEKGAEYSPPKRREVAKDLVKTAEDAKLSGLPEVVVRYASKEWNPELDLELDLRATMLKSANDRTGAHLMEQLKTCVRNTEIDKFAETLYELDKKTGLVEHYDTRITDAYLSTYGLPQKDDAELVATFSKFAASDFAKDKFDGALLQKLASAPEETLESLPTELYKMIIAAFDTYRGK